MSSNSKSCCKIALLPRNVTLPSTALLSQVNSDALKRAQTLTNDNRRADFLWARTLLTSLVQSIDSKAQLIERPPKTPLIGQSARPMYAAISHTQTWIGAAVADCPVAIDLEVMNPVRARPAIFDRVFGEGAWEKYAKDDAVGLFYKTWGLYECAVKLEGKLTGLAHSSYVLLTGQRCAHCFYTLEKNTLLTVTGNCNDVDLRLAKVHDDIVTFEPYHQAQVCTL